MLFQTRYYDQGEGVGFGGSDQASTETINVPGTKTPGDVDPFNATEEQLRNLEEEIDSKVEDKEDVSVDETDESEKSDQSDDADIEQDSQEFMEEDELLEEMQMMGLGEYTDVRQALLALRDLKSSTNKEHQVITRLTEVAKNLNVSPEDIIESIATLNPREMGTQGPQYQNIDKALSKYDTDENSGKFYRDITNAMLEDISPAIAGQFARVFNGLEGKYSDLAMDFKLLKFTSNPKNTGWSGRENEIKEALHLNPKFNDKPNAIDLATKWINFNSESASSKKQISIGVKEKLQKLRENKRKGFVDAPGRGTPHGKKPKEMTQADREAIMDDADKRGISLI